jgi:hypothetical protein
MENPEESAISETSKHLNGLNNIAGVQPTTGKNLDQLTNQATSGAQKWSPFSPSHCANRRNPAETGR